MKFFQKLAIKKIREIKFKNWNLSVQSLKIHTLHYIIKPNIIEPCP